MDSNFHLKVERNGKIDLLTHAEFEKLFEVKYLFNLSFQTFTILNKVNKLCIRAGKDGYITKENIWYGVYYENEIKKSCSQDLYLKWIDDIKEWGLFAKSDMPARTFVGEYTGIVRKYKKRIDDKNPYCFEYSIGYKKTKYTIDAREKGSLIRFVNHKKNGNLTPISVFYNGVMRIVFRTNKIVKKDEELTYDYGPFYWTRREKPI